MMRCGECGFVNEDGDSFCGECRALLRWTGERVEPADRPDGSVDEAPEGPGLVRRVVTALSNSEAEERAGDPTAPSDAAPEGQPPPVDDEDDRTSERARKADLALAEAEAQERQRRDAAVTAAETARVAEEARERARAHLDATQHESIPDESTPGAADPHSGREADTDDDGDDPAAAATALEEAEAAAARASRAAAMAERDRRDAEARRRLRAEAAARAHRAEKLIAPSRPSPAPAAGSPPAGGTVDRGAPASPRGATAPLPPQQARHDTPKAHEATQPSRPRPGELVCGACGAGNKSSRSFCRRCGQDLAESEVVPLPWWQRILPRGRGSTPRRSRRGGAGRARRSVASVLRLVATVSIVAGLLGIAAFPNLRTAANDGVRGLVKSVMGFVNPQSEPVTPIAATASSTLPGTSVDNLIDDSANLWWAEDEPGNGIGARVNLTFEEPVDILLVGVAPGTPEDFKAGPRPRVLLLTFDTGATSTLRLQDANEVQSFEIEDATQVSAVEIEVVRVFRGQEHEDLAITAFEFVRRR